MTYQTKKKFIALQKFLSGNYKSLLSNYPGVVGVHIGQKTRGDKKKNTGRYALVFHVTQKKDQKNKENTIPRYFSIRTSNKTLSIPTDVIESGSPELSGILPGNKVFQKGFPGSFGSASILLTDGIDRYLLSNMHVLGKSQLKNSFRHNNTSYNFGAADVFCQIDDDAPLDIACFTKGIVNDFMDAAIAIINPLFHDTIENTISNKKITDAGKVDFSVAAHPREVIIKGAASGIIRNIAINSNTAVREFKYPLGAMTIFELLQISPCKTRGGDSGSPIIDAADNKLLGIVLGKDRKNTFTYGIPADKLLDFFNLKILN